MQDELMDEIRSTLRDIETRRRYIVNRYGDHEAEICVTGLQSVPGAFSDGHYERHLGYVTTCCEALTLIKTAEALREKELSDGGHLDSEQGHVDFDTEIDGRRG